MNYHANDEFVSVSCEIIGETEKGWKIFNRGKIRCWLPKSQCEWDEDNKIMTMPEWLATQEELI